MDNETSTKTITGGLFSILDGLPAHLLIVGGLALALLAPMVPTYIQSDVNRARLEVEQANSLMELDLEEFKQQQKQQAKNESQGLQGSALSTEEIEKNQKREAEQQAERRRALEEKEEAVKKQYNILSLRRALLATQASVAGTRWPLVLGWLGNLMLLIGLLALTVQSDGIRQKVLLVVLLVVMFSALSGVHLNFQAQGNLGEPSRTTERTNQTIADPNRSTR